MQSAAYLVHRFTTLARLREVFATSDLSPLRDLNGLDDEWKSWIETSLHSERTVPGFFTAINCDALIGATFQGVVEGPIRQAIADLELRLATLSRHPPRTKVYDAAR